MDQISINIASLPNNYASDPQGGSLRAGKGSTDFYSTMQGLMNPVQEEAFNGSSGIPQSGVLPNKEYQTYLESLRKALLAKGKPLNTISLKNEDLFVLKKLLYRCGFTQEKVEKFLKGLVQNNQKGEINLSQFFVKIAELGPPKKKMDQSLTLEPSAIPHIESLLRYFGLTPKEVDRVLRAGRVEGGGLDLGKLYINLTEISKNMKDGTQRIVDRNVVHHILNELESLGIQVPPKGNGDQISMKDFLAALEKMMGGTDKEHLLPEDVKTSIEQVLQKAVFSHNEDESAYSSLSKLRSTYLSSEEDMGKKGNRVAKERLLSPHSLEKAGKAGKGGKEEGLLSPLKTKGSTHAQVKLHSELDMVKGLKGTDKGEESWAKSQTRLVDIPQGASSATFSETIHTVGEDQKPLGPTFPSYLINLVGKQIARSVLRGDRVITLQLKPPDLGVMKVEVDMKDNILKLGMITENSSVKELLLSNAHELREALVHQGVKLEKLDIQISYNFGQALANLKEGPRDGQRDMQGTSGLPFMAEGDTEDSLTVAPIIKNSNQLVDLVA